jgi:hypothetical protein
MSMWIMTIAQSILNLNIDPLILSWHQCPFRNYKRKLSNLLKNGGTARNGPFAHIFSFGMMSHIGMVTNPFGERL